MSLAIRHSVAANVHGAHGQKTNFGSLVSAINRGDVEAARTAFTALNELGSTTPGPLRKGGLDAIGKALDKADLDAAKIALKNVQQGRIATEVQPTIEQASASQEPSAGSSINILV